MRTVKDILYFCNAAIFYDYENIGITCNLNQVRKCEINIFYKTSPHTRNLISVSLIDEIILKIHGNEIENLIETIHVLGGNNLYTLSFEKSVNDEQQTIKPILNDDDDQQ